MVEKINLGKNYRNAFKCDECPQSYEEDGCPAWLTYDEVDTRGMRREILGCGIAIIPHLILQNMKASDRATETVDKSRTQVEVMCQLFTEIVVDHMGIDPQRLAQLIPVKEVRDALPAPSERPDVGHGDGPPGGGDS